MGNLQTTLEIHGGGPVEIQRCSVCGKPLEIYAGGPGSGCNPRKGKCGRPPGKGKGAGGRGKLTSVPKAETHKARMSIRSRYGKPGIDHLRSFVNDSFGKDIDDGVHSVQTFASRRQAKPLMRLIKDGILKPATEKEFNESRKRSGGIPTASYRSHKFTTKGADGPGGWMVLTDKGKELLRKARLPKFRLHTDSRPAKNFPKGYWWD